MNKLLLLIFQNSVKAFCWYVILLPIWSEIASSDVPESIKYLKASLHVLDDITGATVTTHAIKLNLNPATNWLLRANFDDDTSGLRDYKKENPIAQNLFELVSIRKKQYSICNN